MTIAIACLTVFLVMALLMYARRLSALLALPIMALVIAVVAGIPGQDILAEVVNKGALKLHATYTTTMIGAMLAELVNKQGIARSLVRWVAEFSGDNPFGLSIMITLVTALLFSTLGGLGAVIMVGTIVLPVMLSLGISNITAGSLFLFGISLGGMFNIAGWQLYMDVLGARDQSVIIAFVVPFAMIVTLIIFSFLCFELGFRKNWKHIVVAGLFLLACGFSYLAFFQKMPVPARPDQVRTISTPEAPLAQPAISTLPKDQTSLDQPAVKPPPQCQASSDRQAAAPSIRNTGSKQAAATGKTADPASITASAVILVVLLLVAVVRHVRKIEDNPGFALVSPAVPLFLVLACRWEFIPAFIAGILFCVLATWKEIPLIF